MGCPVWRRTWGTPPRWPFGSRSCHFLPGGYRSLGVGVRDGRELALVGLLQVANKGVRGPRGQPARRTGRTDLGLGEHRYRWVLSPAPVGALSLSLGFPPFCTSGLGGAPTPELLPRLPGPPLALPRFAG